MYYLKGLWLILRGKANGVLFFPNQMTAAAKSFWPALWLAPLYFYMMYRLQLTAVGSINNMPAFVIIQVAAYSVYWTIYPVLVDQLLRYLNRQAYYASYLIMYNWLKVVQILIVVLLWQISEQIILNDQVFWVINIAFLILTVLAEWNIVRFGLRLRGIIPLIFLLMDGLIGLFITAMVQSLLIKVL